MNSFVVEEKHIVATINDFDTFCSYIDQCRPKLLQRMEVLGKNDLFELNNQLFFRKDVSAPHFLQESYPYIDLIFNLSLLSGLYRKVGNDKAIIYLESTTRKTEYDGLNPFEKYYFLLEIFWTKFNFMKTMRWGTGTFDQLTKTFSESKPGQELVKGAISERKEYDPIYTYLSTFVYYFKFFGFCSFEPIVSGDKKLTKYDDSISKIIPNEFGVAICKILSKLKLSLWNCPYLYVMGIFSEDEHYNLTNVPFVDHLKPIFPNNALINCVNSETTVEQKGNYTFKAMLDKSTWRKIKLSHQHTLEDLHLSIQDAFHFDNDHLYSFFMDGKRYSEDAYHSSFSEDGPYADEAIISELGLYVGQKILYLFDYGDSWEFIIQLATIEENEEELKEPQITEIKGEAPPQYGFEDDFDDELNNLE
jgi:hypothetical protein